MCGHVTGIDPEIDAHFAIKPEPTLNLPRDICTVLQSLRARSFLSLIVCAGIKTAKMLGIFSWYSIPAGDLGWKSLVRLS